MKINYLAMGLAAAVFLLNGCSEKSDSEMGEKTKETVIIEQTTEKAPGAGQATGDEVPTEDNVESMVEPAPLPGTEPADETMVEEDVETAKEAGSENP